MTTAEATYAVQSLAWWLMFSLWLAVLVVLLVTHWRGVP